MRATPPPNGNRPLPRLKVGAASPAGFNFTHHVRAVCADMTARLDELAHIELDRVAIRFCQARKAVPHGLYASLTPLRFAGGQPLIRRRGKMLSIEPVRDSAGREMLYLLSFYLPRFLNLPLGEKLSTIVHELWHVGPQFNGDLRRHPGRCYAHSGRQAHFDALAEALAAKWLRLEPPAPLYAFLGRSFGELESQYGRVVGLRMRTPRLLARRD